jgi:hypothetical protein
LLAANVTLIIEDAAMLGLDKWQMLFNDVDKVTVCWVVGGHGRWHF